jgi:hypothetical protein
MTEPLNKLISAARKAYEKASLGSEEAPCCEVPLGFGTRVAASWKGIRSDTTIVFERLAWRGVAFALAICAFTAVAHETIASSQANPYAAIIAAPGEDLF